MRDAVIVASSRTPLAKSHRGSFKDVRPDDLAAHAITHVLGKAPALDPSEVEEVILGCGQPHQSQGHNVARIAALRAGLPVSTAGLTVNRFCASGLQAIAQAAHMIASEGADVVIGGGVESISLVTRDASPNPRVQETHPGVYMVMGETAEVVAKRYGISRDAQDEYALVSQQRTARAQKEGFFDGELAPFGAVVKDECNRPETTIDVLAKLPPVFDTTSGKGSVTAGNSSQLSDGASATLVMSAARAKALNLAPLLVFRGYAVSGCGPDEMGIGPVFAVPKLLDRLGVRSPDIGVWELNEAFASQVIYCRDRLGIPMEKLNPNGGSIS